METSLLTIRRAVDRDLPDIVRLLADDPIGVQRERFADPLPTPYYRAFEAIEKDQNNELVVGESAEGVVVAVMQLTFTPFLTHQGGWRATVEGVRVDNRFRGTGLGRELFAWAFARAEERGCHLIQLTTDKQRPEAKRFYEALGFVASHEGMKLHISSRSRELRNN